MTLDLVKVKIENDGDEFFWRGNDEYELVESGEWQDDGKYQFATNIFKDKDGKHWAMNATRNGSYFTVYNYVFDGELYRVEQKEVVTKTWAPIKQ